MPKQSHPPLHPNIFTSPRSMSSMLTDDMADAYASSGSACSSADEVSPPLSSRKISVSQTFKPLSQYSTHRTDSAEPKPFPPLRGLIAFCCNIDLYEAVDDHSLERILNTTLSEFIRYKSRNRLDVEGIKRIEADIIGYLNFALVILDELVENPPASGLKIIISRMNGLFSGALTEFLKNKHKEEALPAAFIAGAATTAPAHGATAVVVPKKTKFTEAGKRLLTHIRNNKLYDVQALLTSKPELALEANHESTILSEAAFSGHVAILEDIVRTLKKLSSSPLFPEDYFRRAVGKGKDNKLPALLWAAINGKFEAVQFLWSVEEIKMSLELDRLEEVIEEVSLLETEEKAPNSYHDIRVFLQTIHHEISPTVAAKESSMKGKGGVKARSHQHQHMILSKAIHKGDTDVVRSILAADPSIAAYSDSNESIFSEATSYGNLEIVQLVMACLPKDYNYGQLFGEEKPQSAVLMSALAGKLDILQYLLLDPGVVACIAQRDIFLAFKKIESFLRGEKTLAQIEKATEWPFHKFHVSREDYEDIYHFLENVYYTHVARADIPKSARERYLDCHIPGRGMLFSPPPPIAAAGTKRRLDEEAPGPEVGP